MISTICCINITLTIVEIITFNYFLLIYNINILLDGTISMQYKCICECYNFNIHYYNLCYFKIKIKLYIENNYNNIESILLLKTLSFEM